MDSWRHHLIDDNEGIDRILREVRRIAVLGIKTEGQADQPAFYVPELAQRCGYEIVPVPVYYPEAREILGQPVHRSLATVAPAPDMVNVFRRSEDVPKHLDDLLACRPRIVWMQLGIRNDGVAESLAREGIDVVQDRCLKIELRRTGRIPS